MGAWGVQTFENDQALDFVADIVETNSLELVVSALDAIGPGIYLEAPDCESALVAAELIAALRGYPSPNLPDKVADWVRSSGLKADDTLSGMARVAVNRIGAASELRELWEDSTDFGAWEVAVRDLESRLGGA